MGWMAVEVSAEEAARPGAQMPEGVYVFSADRIHRSTNSGATWTVWVNYTSNSNSSQGLARGSGFFAQSGIYRRKDGNLLHGTRLNTNDSFDGCAGSQLWLSENGGTSFHCTTRPVAGHCGNANSPGLNCNRCESLCNAHPANCSTCWASLPHECMRCGKYTQFITAQCDTPAFPPFLGFGDHYTQFLRLRDDRLLLTYSHRLCEWKNDDGFGTGLRGFLSYDDGSSFDLQHDEIILIGQDDFYPRCA